MLLSREYKKTSKGFNKFIISVYLGFMLLLYLGYILLDNYRLGKAEQLVNTNLSQGDFQNIQQLGLRTSIFEVSLSVVMLLAALLFLRYSKGKKPFVRFIILHLCLFAALLLIGYILSSFLIAPIGNSTQPIILSSFLLGLIVIIMLIKKLQSKRSKSV